MPLPDVPDPDSSESSTDGVETPRSGPTGGTPRGGRTDGARPPSADGRRADPRLRFAECPPLWVRGLAAAVHDISRNGICLIVDEPPARGERLRLELVDARAGQARTLDAEVLWHAGDRVGLRWLRLTPEDDRWLLERFQAWLGGGGGGPSMPPEGTAGDGSSTS